jgi:hypothetical protein
MSDNPVTPSNRSAVAQICALGYFEARIIRIH